MAKKKPASLQRFEQSVLPYLEDSYRFAYALVAQKEEAEDLVQEAFARAFRFFHQFQQGTNAKAWLFTIIRNLWREKGRKKQKESKIEVEEVLLHQALAREGMPSLDPEELWLVKCREIEIQKLLGKIPPLFREVVVLCDLEGYPYREASQFLKVKEGTIKSRLFRGRQLLKKALLKQEKENEM